MWTTASEMHKRLMPGENSIRNGELRRAKLKKAPRNNKLIFFEFHTPWFGVKQNWGKINPYNPTKFGEDISTLAEEDAHGVGD